MLINTTVKKNKLLECIKRSKLCAKKKNYALTIRDILNIERDKCIQTVKTGKDIPCNQ